MLPNENEANERVNVWCKRDDEEVDEKKIAAS